MFTFDDITEFLLSYGWVLYIVIMGMVAVYCIANTEEVPYYKYKLSDGTIVECKMTGTDHGTLTLSQCKDGNIYLGQVNVIELKGEH